MSRESIQPFEIAGGSVVGRSHARLGRANQDAYAFRQDACGVVAVVCDGCGSGAYSEVGARIGARLVTERVARALAGGASLDARSTWEEVTVDVLAALRAVATAMGGDLAETVVEHFLFTVVGLAVRADGAAVFAAGDGLFAINGEATVLGPFPRNEPPYLAYGLLGRSVGGAIPALGVRRSLRATELQTALLGTDGASDLREIEQFWGEDRYFRNRDAIRRRLSLVNRESPAKTPGLEPALLEDDTTVVVVRRSVPKD